MSDTTSPRFGSCRGPIGALLAGAQIIECGAFPMEDATGDCDKQERRRQSHSLVAGPENSLFCNNKFVSTAGFARAKSASSSVQRASSSES